MSPTAGRDGFEFSFGKPGAAAARGARPQPDAPFRIAVLADFSGRGSRGVLDVGSLATRRVHRVDIDNLDETMAAMGVCIRINAPTSTDVRVNGLDDLHPDHLFKALEMFAPLRELRAQLLDPATFAAAAERARREFGAGEFGGEPAAPQVGAERAGGSGAVGAAAGGAGLLESLLGGAVAPGSPAKSASAGKGGDVASIVRRMVQSTQTDAAPAADPERDAVIAAVDAAIGSRMRTVLHSPAFQRVEAAWRAVHLLITSIQTDEDLTIDLVDVSRAEIMTDLQRAAAAGDLRSCALGKLLMDRSVNAPGGTPWSLLVADLTLDFTTTDAALGAHLAAIASRAGAPMIAAASAAHVGCASFALTPDPDSWSVRAPANDDAAPAAWGAVRQSPEAEYLALALPRLLIRHPYSPGGEEVEGFGFCEIASPESDHESYLWANPAFAAAVIIAQAFTEDGADMVLPDAGEITGLPVHTYTTSAGGAREKAAVPCAEAWLTIKASHAVQTAGFSPLLSIKGRDAARLATIQSIADPIAPLAGRWS